jgi:hypothetical protein
MKSKQPDYTDNTDHLEQRRQNKLITLIILLIRPNLFAICNNNTFSKWWEVWRMSCRRVLSSTDLLVRGSETVWDSGERKLTDKNYKCNNRLESGKKVIGPISAQTLVDWLLGEWGNKFIVCARRRTAYRELKQPISSVAVGIWMSLRMAEFDTHQGASTISRKTLDWKRSEISMSEFDAVPQSWMP